MVYIVNTRHLMYVGLCVYVKVFQVEIPKPTRRTQHTQYIVL